MIPANELIKLLREESLTIALAESVTGGLAIHSLITFKGSGEVVRCSIVAYDPVVKTALLKVPSRMIRKFSAESPQVTMQMAKGLAGLKAADISVAITGLAAAGGSETASKPVGTVFYAVSWKRKSFSLRKNFRGTPLQIRRKACNGLFRFLLQIVKQQL